MNYPIYPNMGMPNMGMPLMDNMMGMPNMMMPSMVTTQNGSSVNNDQISKLEQRINMLERRVSALEGNNTSYNSSGYQML